ncbi:GAF domain-containing protein [Hymenobacter sp. BT683]|uniref:GAF domain-containing protein n=1 Tax=Hymenobacter jeongseonensis TaxID=2791027 RepID=A0ABS0ILU3_9BACT|nr:GAF domain-containing protein [Hymenobacter jeongseonensis]MBF9239339.1 GAF domain-containing protein [Hymenobacter jeongseonensis]
MLTPAALLPPDEAKRLASLRHYDFRPVPADDIFQDLLALTAQLFSQPLAFLALVDEHEVRFPVLHGGPPMPPIPRVEALCSSAILHPNAVAYENLAAAAQTGADAPAIRAALALGLGFYAAAPLGMPDGRTIGVLCVIGPHARPFSPPEQEVLVAIADVASLSIAVRHLCLATPELGTEQWQTVCRHLRHDVHALRTFLRDAFGQNAPQVPVAPAVLHQLQRRLQALRVVLAE